MAQGFLSKSNFESRDAKISVSELEFVISAARNTQTLINRDYSSVLGIAQLQTLVQQIRPSPCDIPVRVSRGASQLAELNAGLSVVVRRYLRGGWMRRLLKDRFILLPFTSLLETRPVRELLTLAVLRGSGVRVPLPMAAMVCRDRSGVTYQGAIITEVVKGSENLLEIGCRVLDDSSTGDRFTDACFQAGREARKMLQAGVTHPDLHPGNVLIAGRGEVFLIDFDRAKFIGLAMNFVRREDQLIARWSRSVRKHNLGEPAIEAFAAGLKAGEQ